MNTRLSPELLSLLERVLNTMEKLEVAWQLMNARGRLAVEVLCTRIKLDPDALESTVEALAAARIINRDAGASSLTLGARARSPDFDALMQKYSDDPASVMSALTSIAVGRIRAMAALTFSDAFVIARRKKRGNDD